MSCAHSADMSRNAEFEMTTDSPNNSFVEDGKLYIVPTLSSDIYGMDAIMDNYVLNLTAQGICTGDKVADCVIGSNNTWGNYSVLPPISSARLTTKLSKSIKYGRVEVQAKMPTGDWIWPASEHLFRSLSHESRLTAIRYQSGCCRATTYMASGRFRARVSHLTAASGDPKLIFDLLLQSTLPSRAATR